ENPSPKAVAQELEAVLRSVFDRYAALERSIGLGSADTFHEGQGAPSKGLRRGHEHGNIPASETRHNDGNSGTVLPRAMPSHGSLYSSSASPRSRLSGRVSPALLQPHAQAKSLSAVKSPVLSTPAMEAVTPLKVSLDGVLLFIGDTNIFPMLSFENILATAAKEIEHMASTVAE
ncbi:unnamed protein product, partial [Ectocarpus sp. 4 AP-2014]